MAKDENRLDMHFFSLDVLLYSPFNGRWVSNGVVGSPAFAAYDQGFAL